MAWLFVPEAEDLSSGSDSRPDTSASDIEVWVTLSGKPSRRPLSWRGWKARAWISLLIGTISRPSMAVRGAARWILSLPDIHASHFPSPESERGKRTSGTSGPKFSESFARYDRASRSLKTCQDTFGWDSTESSLTLPKQGSMRSGELSARQESGHRTSGRGSSAWPTAMANDCKAHGMGKHNTLTDATVREPKWRTPAGSDGEGGAMDAEKAKGHNPKWKLRDDAANWPTPAATDDNKSPEAHLAMKARMKGGPRKEITSLQVASKAWPTPEAADGSRETGYHMRGNPTLKGAAAKQWPTPNTEDAKQTGGVKSREDGRQAMLHDTARKWPTPQVGDGENSHGQISGDFRNKVEALTENWPTPRANATDSTRPNQKGGKLLAGEAKSWPSPKARDWKSGQGAKKRQSPDLDKVAEGCLIGPPDPVDGSSGAESSKPTPDSGQHWQTPRVGPKGTAGEGARHGGQPKGRKLNPRFVEWLMGWPDGWSHPLLSIDKTDFDSWEMESCRLLRQLLS